MKFLCLAYGDEDGWNSLSEAEQQNALSHDEVIKAKGNLVSAVRPTVTAVRNWEEKLEVTSESHSKQSLPLAGFAIIEAESLDEVIKLVSNTPCAVARGVIEIRPFWDL